MHGLFISFFYFLFQYDMLGFLICSGYHKFRGVGSPEVQASENGTIVGPDGDYI